MKMENYNWKMQIIRSNRRTIAIQINTDLSLTVRAPYGMSERRIWQFVEEKSAWIEKHMRSMQEKIKGMEANPVEPMTTEELRHLAEDALSYIPKRVAFYARQMQVSYGRITIRNQRTRWGSCSAKGNLNFNCLLMLAPAEVIDYVVVHELCHRREMNHSERFWGEVEKVLPEYKKSQNWLKVHGEELMRRIR